MYIICVVDLTKTFSQNPKLLNCLNFLRMKVYIKIKEKELFFI